MVREGSGGQKSENVGKGSRARGEERRRGRGEERRRGRREEKRGAKGSEGSQHNTRT
jgi:hypothetical protein